MPMPSYCTLPTPTQRAYLLLEILYPPRPQKLTLLYANITRYFLEHFTHQPGAERRSRLDTI